MPRNPAALAWALLIGSEARVTAEDEREVRAMAAYTYKLVSALVPQRVKDSIEDYEGTCDYDGDLWIAAAAYIEELHARIAELEAALAAATEREWALQVGFTACIDTLWRYARLAARERGESETGQLMSANEAVGHFRAALAAEQQEGR